jgi:multicomponent Na+:H+ antiporter subunit D
MKGCAFFAVAGIRARTGKTQIDDFSGLASRMPWTAAAFTVAAISMIGLPPTAGFFSKYYLVTAAIQAAEWPFAAALAISSVLNAVYFFRVIERLYLQKSAEETPVQDAPRAFLIPAMTLAGMILALGLANQSLVNAVITHALPAGLAP